MQAPLKGKDRRKEQVITSLDYDEGIEEDTMRLKIRAVQSRDSLSLVCSSPSSNSHPLSLSLSLSGGLADACAFLAQLG